MWRNSKNTKKRENEIKHLRLKNRKAKQSVPETGKEEVEEIEGIQKVEGIDESENASFDIGRGSAKRHRCWSSSRGRSSFAIVVGLEERK